MLLNWRWHNLYEFIFLAKVKLERLNKPYTGIQNPLLGLKRERWRQISCLWMMNSLADLKEVLVQGLSWKGASRGVLFPSCFISKGKTETSFSDQYLYPASLFLITRNFSIREVHKAFSLLPTGIQGLFYWLLNYSNINIPENYMASLGTKGSLNIETNKEDQSC